MRKVFYTYSATEAPADPTINSTEYTGALPYANGYYKAIAKDGNVLSAVTSKSFGVAPTDYIAYYPFNGNTNDVTGNFNAINYGATLTTGKDGLPDTAYSFAENSFILSDFDTSQINNAMTIFVICKPTSSSPTALFGNNLGVPDVATIECYINNNNKLVWVRINNGNYITITNGISSINQWYKIAITVGGGMFNIYVDGILIAETAYTGIMQNVVNKLHIGNRGNMPYNTTFSGSIDEVKIYNRALTQDEINSL